jgi:hypothetical protein
MTWLCVFLATASAGDVREHTIAGSNGALSVLVDCGPAGPQYDPELASEKRPIVFLPG